MKRCILIVDDMDINREILAEAFRDKYEIIEADNRNAAMEYIRDKSLDIAAVLLDMVMPEADGLEVLRRMNDDGSIIHIPTFIVTATDNEEELMQAYNLGAVDVITKPFIMEFLKCRIENIIELYSHRNELEGLVTDQVQRLSRFNSSMVETLATLVEFRDCDSGGHIKRICSLTDILMNKVSNMFPEYRLPKAEIDKIVTASVLHDVGKIAVSDGILNKPGRLTPEEFEIMKGHTVKGCAILQKMSYLLDDNVYNYSYDIARHHHERWDGKGYPDHLVGDKISIWSQVVSVVDVYDALVSPRVYKKAFDHDTAVRMIMGGECGVFNPKILKAFELSLDKIRAKHLSLCEDERLKSTGIANILIVDASEIDRSILKNILAPVFKTVEAATGYAALTMLEDKNSAEKIDGVLLDISMPILDGFTVLKMMRENGLDIPVVLMTAGATKENVERGMKYNISGFFGKPFNPHTVITKLRSIFNAEEEQQEEPQEERHEEISALDVDASMAYFTQLKNVYAVYLRNSDRDDCAYIRAASILEILLEEYAVKTGDPTIDREHIMLISKAAYLYDIGQMGVPDADVKSAGKFGSTAAYEDHAKMGAFIVRLNRDKACSFFVDACAEMCMHHHERYDGSGYPHRLQGSDITCYTNMLSLCIEFDRIFEHRSEHNDMQFDFVMRELGVDAGRFDPDNIALLDRCRNQVIMYYKLLRQE